jgi:hypothetical protein
LACANQRAFGTKGWSRIEPIVAATRDHDCRCRQYECAAQYRVETGWVPFSFGRVAGPRELLLRIAAVWRAPRRPDRRQKPRSHSRRPHARNDLVDQLGPRACAATLAEAVAPGDLLVGSNVGEFFETSTEVTRILYACPNVETSLVGSARGLHHPRRGKDRYRLREMSSGVLLRPP